jgi:hypothetical protein
MSRQSSAIDRIDEALAKNIGEALAKNKGLRGLVANLLNSTRDMQGKIPEDQRAAITNRTEGNVSGMSAGKFLKSAGSEAADIPQLRPNTPPAAPPSSLPNTDLSKVIEGADTSDADLSVLNQQPNTDLVKFVQLFDCIVSSNRRLHAALMWPHIPPRVILPWMVREVSRGHRSPPLRTIFLNMSRSALQAMSGVEAKTDQLRALGVYRSGRMVTRLARAKSVPTLIFICFLETRGRVFMPFR